MGRGFVVEADELAEARIGHPEASTADATVGGVRAFGCVQAIDETAGMIEYADRILHAAAYDQVLIGVEAEPIGKALWDFAKDLRLAELRSEGDLRTITGLVPLAEMFGYSTVVRSLSQGRASYAMTPDGFVDVPEGQLEARGLTWA